jgi:osmotically-inducible protein OsmY
MFGRNQVTDRDLLKSVSRRLDRTGTGSQSRIAVTVRGGTVTLAGKLQYENQRTQIVKAASSVDGVRQVVDQLQSPPKTKRQAS